MHTCRLGVIGVKSALLFVSVNGCGKQRVAVAAPAVAATSPTNGAVGLPISQVVAATFNKPLNPATVSAVTFTLSVPGGAAVAGTVSYDPSTSTATLKPIASLAYNALYTATVTSGIMDSLGDQSAGNYVWSFTTAIQPTVLSSVPADGAANVPINQVLSATFSSARNAATITSSTFTLSAGGTAVTGAVTYTPTGSISTFTPAASLAYNTVYTATITTGVTDSANAVWVFQMAQTLTVGSPTVGGVHATAITVAGCAGASCTVLPVQNALAMTAGGGIDIPLTQHISLRAVQAEYMMTRFASVPARGSSNQNDLRLWSGLLFRFGGGMETLPLGLACIAQPTTVFPGDVVMVSSTATNLREKRPATYSWTTNGGVVSGTGAGVQINTVGVTPGTYAVSGEVMQGDRPGQQANCTASFTVHAQEPPTISCSASPESLTAGESSTITAHAVSPQNRPLTYSFSTTLGTVAGNNTAASLSTPGVAPGPITVTCNVVDDLGKSASANSTVTVVAPVAAAPETVAAAPQISNLCAVSFERDRKRPVRVDNEGKACLDDIALQLQHDPAGKLVIVGSSSADEKASAASERTLNSRRYLVADKGIDAHRIELRTHKGSGRTATNVLVPLGAVYPSDDSVIVDSTTAR
ncbi:MAG: Ig-like domain-containing protein [Acidobacteriota bacterium]|nr:Ig-like domain-containing protein [Acidobacteriota bacterium]